MHALDIFHHMLCTVE